MTEDDEFKLIPPNRGSAAPSSRSSRSREGSPRLAQSSIRFDEIDDKTVSIFPVSKDRSLERTNLRKKREVQAIMTRYLKHAITEVADLYNSPEVKTVEPPIEDSRDAESPRIEHRTSTRSLTPSLTPSPKSGANPGTPGSERDINMWKRLPSDEERSSPGLNAAAAALSPCNAVVGLPTDGRIKPPQTPPIPPPAVVRSPSGHLEKPADPD